MDRKETKRVRRGPKVCTRRTQTEDRRKRAGYNMINVTSSDIGSSSSGWICNTLSVEFDAGRGSQRSNGKVA